jgi:hypothetical protein
MRSSVTPPSAGSTEAMPCIGAQPHTRTHAPGAWPASGESIAIDDWNLMFEAVRTRLIHTVGAGLGKLPDVPLHSAELPASLVQAGVLECVQALDQLHAALELERRRRPTP